MSENRFADFTVNILPKLSVAVDPVTTLKGIKVNGAFPIQVNFRIWVDREGRVVHYSCEEVKNFVIESDFLPTFALPV